MTGVTKTLRAFVKHEGSDEISCLIRTEVTVDDVIIHTGNTTEFLSEEAVIAQTQARWDEDDLCTVGGWTRMTL